MAIKTRGDALPYEVGIDATMLNRASKLVAAATSFPVQYNKAIVGRNAFAHESGIHQDGMLKHTQTYEIMTPESVGVSKTSLVMGKHSGRNAFRSKLKEMGYELGDNALEDAFNRFKALADRKKHVYDEDLEALVDEEIAHAQNRVKLVSLTVIAGTMGPQSATATLDIDGRHHTVQSTGNGPVDATFNCIKALIPHEAVLELYQVHAVTQGTDAQAEVSVRLAENGRSVTAKGADPDTLVASAKAYLGALNKLMSRRQKGQSEPLLAERRLHSTDVGGAIQRLLTQRAAPIGRGPLSSFWTRIIAPFRLDRRTREWCRGHNWHRIPPAKSL
jgi:2-isopropylmalate synthase